MPWDNPGYSKRSSKGCVFLLFRARRLRHFAEHSALRGIGFMGLFVYKYIADTSFVMISCVDAGGFVSLFCLNEQLCCVGHECTPYYWAVREIPHIPWLVGLN